MSAVRASYSSCSMESSAAARAIPSVLFAVQYLKTADLTCLSAALGLFFLWVCAAVYAVVHPNRGLHDWLAGAWVVRRRHSPGNPWALASALFLCIGVVMMGRRWLMR